MPLVRITLQAGKPPDYRRALADNVHQALVACFGVPLADRFQTLHELAAEAMIIDRDYLGGPRSADFVLIEITAGRPRSTAQKQALYRCLSERLQASPGISPADVMVVISTTQSEDWSFGHGIASLLTQPA